MHNAAAMIAVTNAVATSLPTKIPETIGARNSSPKAEIVFGTSWGQVMRTLLKPDPDGAFRGDWSLGASV